MEVKQGLNVYKHRVLPDSICMAKLQVSYKEQRAGLWLAEV